MSPSRPILPGDLVGSRHGIKHAGGRFFVPLYTDHPRARYEQEAFKGKVVASLTYKGVLSHDAVGLVLGLQDGYALLLLSTGWGWADDRNIVRLPG